jgi:Lhr-like helicase
MKKLILLLIIIVLVSATLTAQRNHHRQHKVPDKILQLEKIKLIEILEMDEETTLKFFSRRSEFERKMEELNKAINEKLDKMEQMVNSDNVQDEELKAAIEELNLKHQKLDENKKDFINSLDDILSYEQIAKMILFERRFKEELRRAIFRDKRMKNID